MINRRKSNFGRYAPSRWRSSRLSVFVEQRTFFEFPLSSSDIGHLAISVPLGRGNPRLNKSNFISGLFIQKEKPKNNLRRGYVKIRGEPRLYRIDSVCGHRIHPHGFRQAILVE
jgi:hypothetical protein